MKMVKKVCFAASLAAFALGVNVAQAADAPNGFKVAVVNVQEVLQKSPRVSALSKKLEETFKTRQAKIGDEQKALQDKMNKFQKEAPTLSEAQKTSTEKSLSDERNALVKKVVSYQQDLQNEQNKVMQGILKDLNGVVTKVAKTDSYALVLDSQAVIYSVNGNDITPAVAKEFNKG